MHVVVYSAPKVNIIFKINEVFHDIFLFFCLYYFVICQFLAVLT